MEGFLLAIYTSNLDKQLAAKAAELQKAQRALIDAQYLHQYQQAATAQYAAQYNYGGATWVQTTLVTPQWVVGQGNHAVFVGGTPIVGYDTPTVELSPKIEIDFTLDEMERAQEIIDELSHA